MKMSLFVILGRIVFVHQHFSVIYCLSGWEHKQWRFFLQRLWKTRISLFFSLGWRFFFLMKKKNNTYFISNRISTSRSFFRSSILLWYLCFFRCFLANNNRCINLLTVAYNCPTFSDKTNRNEILITKICFLAASCVVVLLSTKR